MKTSTGMIWRALGALALAAALALPHQACLFAGDEDGEEGVVRSEQADVYSSTALVALKVAKVKRGDKVEILRRESIVGPTYTEDWVSIRLKTDEAQVGWIEARHIVSEAVVEASQKVAATPEEAPTFAQGRLKVNQKLRLEPGRSSAVATTLKRGDVFDVIGKAQTTYTPEPKPKKGETADGEAASAEDAATAPDEPETQRDTWYRVRLGDDSIIKGGYILAASVGLEAPDEILHLEGDGRRFVGWQVVNTVLDDKQGEKKNFATFMRRGNAPDDVDFDRIYFLFWDPATHNYYAPYVDSELRGVFPIRQSASGDIRVVTANVLNDRNEPTELKFEALRTDKGRWTVRRVTPPIKGERIVRGRR